jgi:hypothetical protein
VGETRYLPRAVERAVRRLLRQGATRDEAAAAVGITRSLLDTRLRDQLADLRVGQGRRERGRTLRDPTPKQIAARARAIRAKWTAEEASERRLYFSGPIDQE